MADLTVTIDQLVDRTGLTRDEVQEFIQKDLTTEAVVGTRGGKPLYTLTTAQVDSIKPPFHDEKRA